MHLTQASERKRLWWKRIEKPDDYRRGKQTGKAATILHKMKDEKLMEDIPHEAIVSDRKKGEVYINRDKIAYIRLNKDLEATLLPIQAICDKYRANKGTFLSHFSEPRQ